MEGFLFSSTISLCVHVQVFFLITKQQKQTVVFKGVNYKCLQSAGGDGKTDYVEFGQWERHLPKMQCSS